MGICGSHTRILVVVGVPHGCQFRDLALLPQWGLCTQLCVLCPLCVSSAGQWLKISISSSGSRLWGLRPEGAGLRTEEEGGWLLGRQWIYSLRGCWAGTWDPGVDVHIPFLEKRPPRG